MMKSRIHRATITAADLLHEGSLTNDTDVIAYGDIEESELSTFAPAVVYVGVANRRVETSA